MKVAVIQSNYIPWKGYFDIIHDVDLFIFYDDVQYTKNDWRNRNKVKTANGLCWLTIPVSSHDNQLISAITLPDQRWKRKHWETIRQTYAKAPYFKHYRDFFEHFYLRTESLNLSELNQFLICAIARQFLNIKTNFSTSMDFSPRGDKLDRLLDLLGKVGATTYISGPSARTYIDTSRFQDAGINLVYKDYAGYPAYEQFYPPFEHAVSILDLLFYCGPDSTYFIWGWREYRAQRAAAYTQVMAS